MGRLCGAVVGVPGGFLAWLNILRASAAAVFTKKSELYEVWNMWPSGRDGQS